MPDVNEVRRSSGTAKVGAVLGGVGTGLGVLNAMGNVGNFLMGGNDHHGNHCGGTPYAAPCGGMPYAAPYGGAPYGGAPYGGSCPEDHYVNRYDAGKDAQIAKLESDIALRDANTLTDSKILDLYKYVDGKFGGIDRELAHQAVNNQAVKDSFQLAEERTASQGRELRGLIECESKERRCADTLIVNYANATFYAKQVADVETDDTTTAQATYNPLPVAFCS